MRLVPDRIFDKISEINAELLKAEGIGGLILDIDNTMAPRHVELPDHTLRYWVGELKKAGVQLYILSNNHRNRVSRFAAEVNLPFICNGLKPFPFGFKRAAAAMGLRTDQVAAVGDQIFTDVLGAHTAGIRAWLVSPIDPDEGITVRMRRRFEKPAIRKYYAKLQHGAEQSKKGDGNQ